MKKNYSRPGLIEYGAVGDLTLGAGGILPDLTTGGTLINTNCPTQTFILGGVVVTRTSCINATS